MKLLSHNTDNDLKIQRTYFIFGLPGPKKEKLRLGRVRFRASVKFD